MWIGVLADTQGELHTEIPRVLDGMDFIIHCGGIGSVSVLEELSEISPITGVLGKGDSEEEFPFLERLLTREVGGVTILVTHAIGHPMRPTVHAKQLLEEHDPKVLLFGNTGEPFNASVDHRLWFNPGPGSLARGRKSEPSVGILEVDGQSVRGEIVTLPS